MVQALGTHTLCVPLLPFHDTLEDPDRPGRMKDEWTHGDGDHPSVAGYRRLGELAFRL
jgi:lysophospholipase L1-like esterase